MAHLSVLSDKKAPAFVGAYRGTLNQREVLGDISGFFVSDGELAMIVYLSALMPVLLPGLVGAVASDTWNQFRANARLKHFLRR